MATLVLYVFHEYTPNVDLFLRRGLIEDPNITFILIYNHPEMKESCEPQVQAYISQYTNVRLHIRPNVGQDFQGWNDVLFLPTEDGMYLFERYATFIFINSTVAGPYIPTYVSQTWVSLFISKLGIDNVHMCGITANFMRSVPDSSLAKLIEAEYGFYPPTTVHIQSMIFGLDRVGLYVLLTEKLFYPGKQFPAQKWAVIATGEVAISALLFRHHHNVYAFMMGQGLITPERADRTDNFWNNPGSFPLMELMFVKTMEYISFPEKYRYDHAV